MKQFNSRGIFLSGCVFSFTLYSITLAKNVIWGDSAKLTLYSMKGEPVWSQLIAGHPIHTVSGMLALKIFPNHDPALIINLLSALMAAFSVGLAGVIASLISKEKEAPWIAILALTMSHTFWSLGVVAESYSMATCFGLVIFFLLIKKSSALSIIPNSIAGIFSGISTGVNALTMLALPGFIHLQLKKQNEANLLPAVLRLTSYAIGLIIGFALLKTTAFLIGGNAINQNTASTELALVAAEYVRGLDLSKVIMFIPNTFYQFPWLLPIACYSIFHITSARTKTKKKYILLWLSERNSAEWSLMIAAVSVFLFASTYQYQRHFVFLAYSFTFISVLLGIWLAPWLSKIKRLSSKVFILLLIPVINISIYASSYRLSFFNKMVKHRELPGRNPSYFFQPWKHTLKPTAEEWGNSWISDLPQGSIILADFTPGMVLEYCRLKRRRYDLAVQLTDRFLRSAKGVNQKGFIDFLETQLAKGVPVFLGDKHQSYYFIADLKKRYHLEPYKNGYRVSKN